jgi:hypothetical protein
VAEHAIVATAVGQMKKKAKKPKRVKKKLQLSKSKI